MQIYRNLILILALIVASVVTSHAQYVYPDQITSKGSKILVDGEKLSSQQAAELFSNFAGTDMGDQYLKNRKGYKTGVGLAAGGASMVIVGYASTIVGGLLAYSADYDTDAVILEAVVYTGATLAISGALMMTAGIPTAIVYRHRIKKSVEQYNSASSKPLLTIAPARSGIGVALRF